MVAAVDVGELVREESVALRHAQLAQELARQQQPRTARVGPQHRRYPCRDHEHARDAAQADFGGKPGGACLDRRGRRLGPGEHAAEAREAEGRQAQHPTAPTPSTHAASSRRRAALGTRGRSAGAVAAAGGSARSRGAV